VALAGVVDGEAEGAEGGEEGLDVGDYGARRCDGVALGREVAALFADCFIFVRQFTYIVQILSRTYSLAACRSPPVPC